jgi:hypothetical protein
MCENEVTANKVTANKVTANVVTANEPSSLKIAITFLIPNDPMDIFTNGIKQNTLFFYELMQHIGYDVYLIIDDSKEELSLKEGNFWNTCGIRFLLKSKIVSFGLNLVIQMGFELEPTILDTLFANGVKTVWYTCGNSYFAEAETCLYHPTKTMFCQYNNNNGLPNGLIGHRFDQIWVIPQLVDTNLHYLKTLYRCECIEVPFIWSPSILQSGGLGSQDSLMYKNPKSDDMFLTKCAIFEPNLSIMKWSFPAVLVCENAYRPLPLLEKVESKPASFSEQQNTLDSDSKNGTEEDVGFDSTFSKSGTKSGIGHLFITNMSSTSGNNLNHPMFTRMIQSLDLFKDKKMSVESRYNSLLFMSKHADVAVSHQFENPLNYLYLDLAWMGWAVVHNAHMCKDVGYFYEGFNYEMGGNVLRDVMQNHHSCATEYLERNRRVIDRYLPTNKNLQKKYKLLVDGLFI